MHRHHESSAGLAILVVEDDPVSRKALMTILRRLGHKVEGAECARQAIQKFDAQPDLVVLDLMLPDGLGIAVLQHIRMRGLRTRVAILTGVEQPQSIAEVTEYEPDAIFSKPLQIEMLTRWMDTGACPADLQ